MSSLMTSVKVPLSTSTECKTKLLTYLPDQQTQHRQMYVLRDTRNHSARLCLHNDFQIVMLIFIPSLKNVHGYGYLL